MPQREGFRKGGVVSEILSDTTVDRRGETEQVHAVSGGQMRSLRGQPSDW